MKKVWMTMAIATAVAVVATAGGQQVRQASQEVGATLDPALPEYKASAALTGEIRTSGNLEDMGDLMKLWVANFNKVQPGIHFSLDPTNTSTGKGVRALLAGIPTDITLTGREMRAPELAQFVHRFGYEPSFIPVAGGAYQAHGKSPAPVFFVNSKNPITKLSLDQIDSMYSKTRKRGGPEITSWGQLGLKGEWANRPIVLYGLNAAAGTWTFLRDRLLLGGEYKDAIKAVKYENEDADWNEMVSDVAADANGIGLASGRWLKGNPNVKALALAETPSSTYYYATLENVEAHRYPLTRDVYITLNLPPGKNLDAKVKEFLSFILSREGQEAVRQEGEFLPLPATIVKTERRKLGLGSAATNREVASGY